MFRWCFDIFYIDDEDVVPSEKDSRKRLLKHHDDEIVQVDLTSVLKAYKPQSKSEDIVEDEDYFIYRIQDGDSLPKLALRFGVRMEDIKFANGLTSNDLGLKDLTQLIRCIEEYHYEQLKIPKHVKIEPNVDSIEKLHSYLIDKFSKAKKIDKTIAEKLLSENNWDMRLATEKYNSQLKKSVI